MSKGSEITADQVQILLVAAIQHPEANDVAFWLLERVPAAAQILRAIRQTAEDAGLNPNRADDCVYALDCVRDLDRVLEMGLTDPAAIARELDLGGYGDVDAILLLVESRLRRATVRGPGLRAIRDALHQCKEAIAARRHQAELLAWSARPHASGFAAGDLEHPSSRGRLPSTRPSPGLEPNG